MIKELKYKKSGHRVWRQSDDKTGYLSFEVFPTNTDVVGVFATKDRVDIPNFPNRSPEEAESVAKAITLCVLASREINTGIKKTCLDS